MQRRSVVGVKVILLDIEGTICPISFVKDVLFPYALKALPQVLRAHWIDPSFKPYLDAFPAEYRTSPEVLEAHVRDLTERDVKVAYLKNLQGYLWESGYKSGAYATPLFSDVVPCLRKWLEHHHQHHQQERNKKEIAIYSSGSVFAQKLLFAHVKTTTALSNPNIADGDSIDDAITSSPQLNPSSSSGRALTQNATTTEDLTGLISDWFDTVNAGPKTLSSSYQRIVNVLMTSTTTGGAAVAAAAAAPIIQRPDQVLFLSDNPKEVDAAVQAGMQAAVVVRPGNVPLSSEERDRFGDGSGGGGSSNSGPGIIESFEELELS